MKENHPKHIPVDAGSLWVTLQELEAGTILPEDRAALVNLLTHSPEAQNIYLEYFELSAMIADEAKTHSEISCLPCVPEAPENPPSPSWIGRIPNALWIAAAAVLILAITLKLLPPLLQNQVPSPALTLKAVPGSQWAIDGQPGHTDKLAEGSTLHVTSGTVKLHHESGASLIVQGPATVAFPKLNQPVLENGWLWLDSEHDHNAFEITTPELLIHDIGTRFGVHVTEDGPAAIHLLEGQVDAFSRTHDRKLVSLKPENRAITINAEGNTSVLALSPDPFPSIDQLLSKTEDYKTTILSQSPSGYWKLDDEHKDTLTNRVAGGTAGRLHPQMHNDAPGPQSSQGFSGFGQGNRAVHFSAKDLWAPLSLGSAPFHNSTLFKEDFSTGGKLHGSPPTLGLSESRWIATQTFDRNGDLSNTSVGTATLAFNPVNGVVYTLDASFSNLSAPAESDDAWVALAFSHGQGISSMIGGETENRFLEGQTTGRAWMLFRVTDTSLEPFACLGTSGKQGGLADPAPWENWKTGHGGDIDMRIVLDTTDGAGYWKATWFAKRPSEAEYTMVRTTTELMNEAINSVGIAVGKPGVSGSVKSFVLKAAAASPKTQQERLAAAPSTMTRSAGAVSMWIRPEGTDKNDQIIWAAGNSPDNDSMHLRITPSGHVRFFMDNDRYDLLVSSDAALTKNTWQHLVATWSTDTAEIHINGKLVASDGNFMEMPPDELPEFYFGSGPIGSRFSNFVGTIDEIVTYNRFLTTPEIQRQYEAAR